MEAFDFLLSCPHQEGPLYESALEACFSALIDGAHVSDAQHGLRSFARAHGLLAEGNSASTRTGARRLRVAWRTPAMPQPSQFRGH